MKKQTTINTKYQEEMYEDSFPAGTNPAIEPTSPYLHDASPDSDNESMSDSSRKIRKKRNTYQKISDDIRVQLLDAVQNGETLKSAAKRHKINYSSAKSILHTYRKEGRILKKSAQERTTKKRSSPTEIERPSKISKLSRKENMQPEEDESTSQSYNTSSDKKHEAHGDENGEANHHVMGLLNSNYDHHHADHDIQAPSDAAPPSAHQAYPKSDGPLTVRKHDNIAESHHGDYHKGAKGDHQNYKGRNYDNAHAGHHGEHDSAADHYHHGGHYAGHHAHHDHGNHANHSNHGNQGNHGNHGNYHYPREMDSFNDAVNMWQARSAHQDPNSFLYGRYALPTHHYDTHKDAHHDHGFEDHGDSSVGFLLKSFMDIQNNHYQPIRKSSFVSYTGNGFRKESFDFI